MTPKRIQMTRQSPWRKDNPDAVVVSRGTRWGNPFPIGKTLCTGHGRSFEQTKITDRTMAVAAFTDILAIPDRNYPSTADIIAHLRGKDLACWCPLDQPCHADVLLRVANS
jgi:hypothetical protein